MAVRINHAPHIAGLYLELERIGAFVDDALDRGDRRDFRVWAKRWRAQAGMLADTLTAIVEAR